MPTERSLSEPVESRGCRREHSLYRELPPPPAIARHVACLWWREGVAPRVLPDGCVDLVWTGERLILAGPATQPLIPRAASRPFVRLGVRLRIGAAAQVLGMPASELRNLAPVITDVRMDGAELEERLSLAATDAARLGIMAGVVSNWVSKASEPDPLVRAAAQSLLGGAAVAQLAHDLAISERQLRRRVEHAVGYSPKILARVLRLQRFLAVARRRAPLALVAAEAGYADQPHLTRECRDLAGLTPAVLVEGGATPAGERFTEA